MDETFPGMKFESVIVQPTRLLDSKVVLVIPEELPNWEIRPKRLPPVVSTCDDICVYIVCSFMISYYCHRFHTLSIQISSYVFFCHYE